MTEQAPAHRTRRYRFRALARPARRSVRVATEKRIMMKGWVCLLAGLGVCAAALLGRAGPAAAGEDEAAPRPADAEAPGCGPGLTVRQLLRMSRPELEQLYCQGRPVPVPGGFARGTAIQYPGTGLAVPAARATHLLWQGKFF